MSEKVQKFKACVDCAYCQKKWVYLRFGREAQIHIYCRPYTSVITGEMKSAGMPCRSERYTDDRHHCGLSARFFKRGKWRPG